MFVVDEDVTGACLLAGHVCIRIDAVCRDLALTGEIIET